MPEESKRSWTLEKTEFLVNNLLAYVDAIPHGLPMVVLSYGKSTWQDFIDAYNNNVIVYCRASSNSNPASGAQTRMAFMAYVNSATPTEVEFQYYRSVSTHSNSQQGDQVFIYKLNNKNGGTWSVTTRQTFTAIAAGTGLSGNWSNGTLTLGINASASDEGKFLQVVNGSPTWVEIPNANGVSF